MEKNRREIEEISFHEDEVKLAKKMIDTLRTTMEFLYYLMEHRKRTTLTMILISTEGLNSESLLQNWKRDTDILFEIDTNIYVFICQSTDEEGAIKFSNILLSNIKMHGGTETYCVVSELKSTYHSIQDVVFKTVEQYMIVKESKRSNQINFTKFENPINYVPSPNEEDVIY